MKAQTTKETHEKYEEDNQSRQESKSTEKSKNSILTRAERLSESTEIQKMANPYQDVCTNEVTFRGEPGKC